MNPKVPLSGFQNLRGLPHFIAQRKRVRQQKGFTLIEVLVVLAIAGAALAGVLVFQANAESRNRVNNTINAVINTVGNVKSIYASAGSYATVTSANLVNAGVVTPPFTISGTTILDPWGGTVTVGGSGPFFGMSFLAPDNETCVRLVSALASNAVRVTVHTAAQAFTAAATTPAAFMATGTVVKADASTAYDPVSAATGCGAAAAHIGLVFR